MTIINIYNKLGEKINEFSIKDSISYIGGRISGTKKGIYYKGSGLLYEKHFSLTSKGCYILREIPHLYLKYLVINPLFIGKFGVFQERFHPIYSEFIGACGKREANLVKHSLEFGKSDVKVLDHCIFDKIKQQGYYQVLYSSGRRAYLEEGHPKFLYELLFFMIQEGWNFPWDKDSISDITYRGYITDVADLFKSFKGAHQVGTIYSLLHSLAIRGIKKYIDFIKYCKCDVGYTFNMPVVALSLLKTINNNVIASCLIELEKCQNNLFRLLAGGKNCGYGEYKEYGDNLKRKYLEDLEITGKIIRSL